MSERGSILFWLMIAAGVFFIVGVSIAFMVVRPPTSSGPSPVTQPVTNQYEITAADSGKTFSYPITSRFTVMLDPALYPEAQLQCAPAGIVGSISNVPAVEPPLYAERYEIVKEGTCELKSGAFHVSIVGTNLDGTAGGPDQGIVEYKSGIDGVVMLGPTCPVQRIPPDPGCADKPYQTLVAIYRASDPVHAFALFKSAPDGTFKASLPPGDYTVGAGESTLPRCAIQNVSVGPTTYTHIIVSCDTGIR